MTTDNRWQDNMKTPLIQPIPAYVECEWFHGCHNPSIATITHPTVGDVECCQVHLDWLMEDIHPDGTPNPTKMVPPMAAKHFARLGPILEDDES